MKVKVKFYAYLRDLVGEKHPIEYNVEDGTTVSELLDELFQSDKIRNALLDENSELKPEITILKNGREIKFLEGMKTQLNWGDVLSIFPPVVGGWIKSHDVGFIT
jgi:molybdopterin synthase sulfur carrier subunit